MKKYYALIAALVVALALLGGYRIGLRSSSAAALTQTPFELEPIVGEEPAPMAPAPEVPPPITRKHATKILLDIEVREHTKTLADGVTYTYWSFGDDAPGQFIRVREGDLIETRLSNHPDNTVAHNIDFHAATGPGGGATASFVAPGHSATFSWRALRPGLFLYHCVAAPAGLHLANGMYGLILVEPKEGMSPVDREFFIVQGEFYTRGAYGERGEQPFSMEKAIAEEPEYVVFNGHVGALTGERALRVERGQSVRFYLGNAGPSLVSSFHIVGEVFDAVYGEGGIMVSNRNVQTTLVPVGGSSMVEFSAEVPGDYELVDHSMFRAFNKGAMGMMHVEGGAQPQLFTGRSREAPYNPGTHLRQPALISDNAASVQPPVAHGAQLYATICAACHQPDGAGLHPAIPPLARSDFLMQDAERAVRVLLHGLNGEIVVNGQKYDGQMPNLSLTDVDVAAVLSYVRSNFGNIGTPVSPGDVSRIRLASAPGTDPQGRGRHER